MNFRMPYYSLYLYFGLVTICTWAQYAVVFWFKWEKYIFQIFKLYTIHT